MPYIEQAARKKLDPWLAHCRGVWDAYHLAKTVLGPCKRYHHFAKVLGALTAAACEAVRRSDSTCVDISFKEDWLHEPPAMRECVRGLAQYILETFNDPYDGIVNYCVTVICDGSVDSLEMAVEAFYKYDVGPYEDKAIEKNGDIPVYAPPATAPGQ